jgi:hypothetical protein
MSNRSMPARLTVLDGVLHERVSKSSGGWPHWLHIDRASTSLVGTAHTLAILCMLGHESHDDLITGGMRYLAREVKEQIKPGGRGAYARYPAYALWGLMRFPGGVSDPEVFEGAKFSASWLMRRTRSSGAWTVDGVRDEEMPISLPATMAAVHGLDRLAPYVRGSYGDRCLATTAAARDAVMAAAETSGGAASWRQRPGAPACPGATSLAVLTLAGGSHRHREMARQGLEYLRANPKAWTTSVHIDDQLEHTWRIMSFSLGLRALLHPCAIDGPSKQTVQEVIAHFDDLWDERTGGWAVQQGHDASTTGSYAVLAAVRALKNAWQFDPVAAYGLPKRRARASGKAAQASSEKTTSTKAASQRQVRLVANRQAIVIKDPMLSDQEFYVIWDSRAVSQWGILEALLLLKQQANGRKRPDQYDYTLSPSELAVRAKSNGISAGAVDRTVRRINAKIAAVATEARIHSFPALIKRIVPGDTNEVRYGIDEADVVLADK